MPHAVLVGAGIAGLVAARALSARGWSTTVFERAPGHAPLGAGIILGANALACLDGLGLGEALGARGHRLGGMTVWDAAGSPLQQVDPGEVHPDARMVSFTRADLHAVLGEGVEVTFAREVVDADEGGVTVDGRRVSADLVVGADGIRSRVRAAVADVPLRYAGQTCWRTLGPLPEGVGAGERWGPGVRLGTVPVRDGRVYSFFVATEAAGTPGGPIDREALARRFAAFGALPGALLATADTLLHHDLYDLPTQVWGRGRLVLIGDAAHAMTPNMGQGAAMGIEDAVVLAEVADAADPAAALRERRQARVAAIAARSWQIGRVAHWESGAARWVRDQVLRLTPRSVGVAQLREVIAGGPVGLGAQASVPSAPGAP